MQVYGRTATWCGATREGVVRDGGARARAEAPGSSRVSANVKNLS
ncbi:hypothetical protein ES288_D01G232400v1 [Gossypium darwinii]|uniref:Uncharacterized protein n=1 Tax=Gossypium darwinii TaxID=34276 RepID=A0A5D2DSY7_GOSDA|nr:hypothetical protein ES288_D01G232400v1 [Gossypium darwinii]